MTSQPSRQENPPITLTLFTVQTKIIYPINCCHTNTDGQMLPQQVKSNTVEFYVNVKKKKKRKNEQTLFTLLCTSSKISKVEKIKMYDNELGLLALV